MFYCHNVSYIIIVKKPGTGNNKTIWGLLQIHNVFIILFGGCYNIYRIHYRKYTEKWGVQVAGMNFQTRSNTFYSKKEMSQNEIFLQDIGVGMIAIIHILWNFYILKHPK